MDIYEDIFYYLAMYEIFKRSLLKGYEKTKYLQSPWKI